MRTYKYSRSHKQATDTAIRNIGLRSHLEALVQAGEALLEEITASLEGGLDLSNAERDFQKTLEEAQTHLKEEFKR